MILGMSTATFTLLHVGISLIGIGSGLIVLGGLIRGRRLGGMTGLFFTTTVLTSLSGFAFPIEHLLPSHKVGILSLVVLAVAIPALYIFHLGGRWRWIYVVTSGLALYLNVFVLIAQLFLKVPALHALAPTGTEPPFFAVQLTVLAIFIALTALAVRNFRRASLSAIDRNTSRAA